jgi:DNA (cytosine-5)-methyltransferase 1
VRELALFAGAGGGLLASKLLGWSIVCGVEINQYARNVLLARQDDGCLEPFPIWDDIRTFDGRIWRDSIDVVSGGFPCQDISSAGKRAGLAGDRSGLWFEMLRVIGEVRPAYVFAENSPNLRGNGLAVVLQGLAGLGFDAAWGVLGAWHVGAPHRRNRMWIVATHPDRCRERGLSEHAEVACAQSAESDAPDADRERPERRPTTWRGFDCSGWRAETDGGYAPDVDWWSIHRFAGMDDGMAHRVERVRASGNGQVPAVAALAWRILSPLAEGK